MFFYSLYNQRTEMHPFHFSLPFVQFLADHRDPLLTYFFVGMSAVGATPCYVLIILAIYVAWDKVLAVRLSYVVLLTMSANDLMKDLIRNLRPFVVDGMWRQKWALSAAHGQALSAEFSTPSGHAMGSASFYGYLAACVKRAWFWAVVGVVIFLVGFSRPYLGVHYGEDVLIGWAIGLSIAAFAARYCGVMAKRWRAWPYFAQIGGALAASAALWLISIELNGWRITPSLHGLAMYTGFLTGNVIAFPLEARCVGFCAGDGTVRAKVLRVLITIAITAPLLLGLRVLFAAMAMPGTIAGLALEYIRYAAAGVAGIYVAPLVFTRLKLAQSLQHKCPETTLIG